MMFKQKASNLCNTPLFVGATMIYMHPTMKRLYQAAEYLCDTTGQSAVARLLDMSPQVVKNWETRGVSQSGLLKAARRIGCSALWLETGNGTMAGSFSEPVAKYVFGNVERQIVEDLPLLLEEDKARIAAEIKKLADVGREYERKFGRQVADNAKVAAALPPAPEIKPKKRQNH